MISDIRTRSTRLSGVPPSKQLPRQKSSWGFHYAGLIITESGSGRKEDRKLKYIFLACSIVYILIYFLLLLSLIQIQLNIRCVLLFKNSINSHQRSPHQRKMSKNIVIATQKPGEAAAVEASVPVLRDDYILVKVKAVALNPTDWKHVNWLTSEGARVSHKQHWPA